jgi:glycosyltransferase involved in cell wall biosynthesis
MRVAFIAQPFDRMQPPVRAGSLALWIYYMARLCAQRGHEVFVFGNHGRLFSSQSVTEDGVRYIFTPSFTDRLLNKFGREFRRRWGDPDPCVRPLFASSTHHAGYAAACAWRARRLGCEAVHVMTYSQFVPVVRRLHPKARIVLHMHCEWLSQLDRETIRPRVAQSDVVVGCSEHITRTVAERFPEFAERCVTIQDSAHVVAEASGPAPGSQALLFVGRLSPEKGIHHLIRAFHLVLQRFPGARLHLVGGSEPAPLEFLVGISDDPYVAALREYYPANHAGPKDPYLQALETEAGTEMGKRILFEGSIPHHKVSEHYRSAAMLVNPSLSEASGIGVLEAMMHGLPIVVTRVGGMTDAVEHGRTGYLTPPADPAALAGAICDVLADPARAREMGQAGRAKAMARFSWESSADQLLQHMQAAR